MILIKVSFTVYVLSVKHCVLYFFFSCKVEEKSSISPLVAGLRKDVQALITEVSTV